MCAQGWYYYGVATAIVPWLPAHDQTLMYILEIEIAHQSSVFVVVSLVPLLLKEFVAAGRYWLKRLVALAKATRSARRGCEEKYNTRLTRGNHPDRFRLLTLCRNFLTGSPFLSALVARRVVALVAIACTDSLTRASLCFTRFTRGCKDGRYHDNKLSRRY